MDNPLTKMAYATGNALEYIEKSRYSVPNPCNACAKSRCFNIKNSFYFGKQKAYLLNFLVCRYPMEFPKNNTSKRYVQYEKLSINFT